MKMRTAKVVHGQLEVPEVTLATIVPDNEDEEGFAVSEEQRSLLLESLEQARRGEGVDGWKLLEEVHGHS
jgi:hypothetical protein